MRALRAHDDIRTDIGTNVIEEFITFATFDDGETRGDVHIAIESATHRFPEEEQEIVARTLEANQYAIASELGID